jgi:hypothetical protein
MHWLFQQHLLHGANRFVSEGKKPMHVIVTIGASDQLVAVF